MESQRQKKFGRLIHKEISDIFLKDELGIGRNHFFTVMEVRMSPDLGVAKVYVSFMLDKEKQASFELLNSRKNEIRNLLGRRIAKQVRRIPELIFYMDEVEENAARIEDILKNLDIPPEKPEE